MEKWAQRRGAVRWAASLALFLPVIVFYLCELLRGDGRSFTGFIQYDQPSYMADARAFFSGGFHLFYGNPYSPNPDTPRIYFQIHLLLLGLVQKVTGWDPGVVYVLFGFWAGLVCVRVAMALYEEVAGLRSRADWLELVLFVWGGGILELMGLGYHAVTQGTSLFKDVFAFDPADGWWFLNLGRNLVYPTEAYYHALALGLILVTLRGNFRAAMALGILLMLSHPFTGLQMLLVVAVWAGIESVVLRNRAVPFLFAGTMAYLVMLHVLYYVILLNMFEEHRVVFAQWSLAWTESAVTSLGADILVGVLAVYTVRTWTLARAVFAESRSRLLGIWFVVSLLLAHHDLFFPAKQPLHFTHGYTWCALFLLGVGPLRQLLEGITARPVTIVRGSVLGLIFVIALSDNLLWFGLQATASLTSRWKWFPDHAITLDQSDRELFYWLMERPGPHADVLVSDPALPVTYLAVTYTDYRGWATHFATTPFARQRGMEVRDFLQTGTVPAAWNGKEVIVILDKHSAPQPSDDLLRGEPIFENAEYRAFYLK